MITPLLHRILIKPEPIETKSKGGIILAVDEKREQAAAEIGIVVSVGLTSFKDYGSDPSLLSKGDKVAFAKYAGKRIKDVDETEYIILNDEDIVAIIRD